MSDLFNFKARTKQYGVMGNPVSHSKSPQIHQLFAQQFGVAMEYNRIQVDIGGFEQAVSHFIAHGGSGLNVTVPFKVSAWRLCGGTGNHLSERAQHAEAVNTIRVDDDGAVFGDNTDGVGMVRDIENNIGLKIASMRVLVLGAGGAVRGILAPLVHCHPMALVVVNRSVHKALMLAEKVGHGVVACSYERLAEQLAKLSTFDLIINGSSASLSGELPDIPAHCFGANSVAYDMMYSQQPTVFMRWALENGAGRAFDGLGMLVEQAAESFYLWYGTRPQTKSVLGALRKL